MAQQGFGQFGGGHHATASVNPNELNFGNQGFQNNFGGNSNNQNSAFSSGSAVFGDDELLEGLGSPSPHTGLQGHEFPGMNDVNMNYNQALQSHRQGIPVDQSHIPGYSNTPDGDPIQSPFMSNLQQYQSLHNQQFQTPMSYGGSPLAEGVHKDATDPTFLQARQRLQAQAMQRKASNARSPLTPKMGALGLSMGSQDGGFGAQPIRTGGPHHAKAPSGQWAHTPSSMTSFPGSGLSSPLQTELHNAQINDFLMKGASMPAKLTQGNALSTQQEAKKKRRRESHNLVERRRRDNINERIQDLSKLVPAHRLEDEKIRKMISNGTPMSPTLAGNSPATSGLAGPGARRATSGAAGNITTGLPIEDKDKGPNKGDILNGAVSWTRDLMWMLQAKIQQQEELLNIIADLGGHAPFETTEDEKRMQTELLEAMAKNETEDFTYSRAAGTGLRVPHHTDYKGEPLNGANVSSEMNSISPEGDANGHFNNDAQFWEEEDIKFNRETFDVDEEDEFMELS